MTGRIHGASVLMPSSTDTTLRHRVIRTLGQSSISIHISDKADKPQALFNEDQAKKKIKTATVIFAFGDQGGQQHSQSSCCFVDGLQLRIRAAVGYPRQYLYNGRSRG